MLNELLIATCQTFYMVMLSGFLSGLLGLFLGIFLFLWRKDSLKSSRVLYAALSGFVNIGRSLPFIILLIAILPFTRLIVGTTIGVNAAIVPLTIGAIPFVARIVESAFIELPRGLLETGISLGASPMQIVFRMLLPEAMTALINGMTLVLISLVGYSAMAGTVGGGGLGDLAIRYGYQRFDVLVMVETIVILIIMVQLFQWLGDTLVRFRIK